jgi:UDP-galactopyranose mutase
MYDFLIVGAGITSAAFCAAMKDKYKICVMDVRPHLGGNCYDYKTDNTYVQLYGPHYFHTSNKEVVDFLSNYTEWNEYTHSVTAEIQYDGKRIKVPFPYSKQTEEVIGRSLSMDERLELFFKTYSKKMWNMAWEDLPNSVKNRVPKDTAEKSVYFPNQFSALPKHGYSRMIENMFDGVDLILGCGPDDWKIIEAKKIIYCGRPDHLIEGGPLLEWRNLTFIQKIEEWDAPTTVVNFCHFHTPFTRKTSQGKMWNTDSKLVIYEKPLGCDSNDKVPYYPVVTEGNMERFKWIEEQIKQTYPNMHLLGRLGSFKYMDMDACVGQALNLVKKLN